MPKNNSINGIHAQRLKDIRSFVDFDFDLRKPLTRYQKSKIRTYHKEIDALTARPYYDYRPRDKDRLKKAQEFAQHEKSLPGLKVAFIPTNGIEKPRISFNKKGELTASTRHVTTNLIQFDKRKLITDPIAHVNQVIKRDKRAKRFTILAGKYEIPNSYSRGVIANQVAKLTERYKSEDKNNYFGNWMHGLASHHFKQQADFNEYRAAKMKSKMKLQNDRKNAKRRQKRKSK